MTYPQSPNHGQFHTGTHHEDGAVVGSTSALKAAQAKRLSGAPTAPGTRSADLSTFLPRPHPVKDEPARDPLPRTEPPLRERPLGVPLQAVNRG